MRKLHAGDVLSRKMTQRTFSLGVACVPKLRVTLEQWQGTLPVLPEDEVEDRGDVYQHAEEPKYTGEHLGDGG